MTKDESEALQKQGANARAAGLTSIDCPFYKEDATPSATGETIDVWNAKVEAWRLGWTIEDAMRG